MKHNPHKDGSLIIDTKLTTQQETITWHKYPETRPNRSGVYIVRKVDGEVLPCYWSEGKGRFSGWDLQAGQKRIGVIRDAEKWCEMPKGWKE